MSDKAASPVTVHVFVSSDSKPLTFEATRVEVDHHNNLWVTMTSGNTSVFRQWAGFTSRLAHEVAR